MALYEYYCDSCCTITELFQTPSDGGPKTIKCKTCKNTARKVQSAFIIRMHKLMEPGGEVYQDQKDNIGAITGDHQEESAKEYSDYNQAKAKGKGMDYIFNKRKVS